MEVTDHHFCCMILVTQNIGTMWKHYADCEYHEVKITGALLETSDHNYYITYYFNYYLVVVAPIIQFY